MPKPTMSDLHVNRPLTNISTAYMNEDTSFVASEAFPEIPVQKESDKYFVWNKGDMLRIEARERAPGAKVIAGGVGITTASYQCVRYAARWDVPDPLRDNADDGAQLDKAAAEWVSQQMLMKKESVWATKYFATGLWTTDYDGVTGSPSTNQFKRWDASGSTPLTDIAQRRKDVLSLTGKNPNVLVLSFPAYTALINHADIVARYQYTKGGDIGVEQLKQVFAIDKVLIGQAIQNTANEGATDSLSFLLGKHALLCYAEPSPGLMKASAGYTFSWTGYNGAGSAGNRIKKYRLEEYESDVVEGELYVDMKLVGADLGAFFEDAVS